MAIAVNIASDAAGMRVDRYIRENYSGAPQNLIEKLARRGRITLNGEKVKTNARVQCNQTLAIDYDFVTLDLAERKAPPPTAVQTLEKAKIFEDSRVVVFNKPTNLSSQDGSGIHYSVDSVLRHIGKKSDQEYRLVHRIDKCTTGVLVVAKTRLVAAELAAMFKKRLISKVYVAVIWGVPPKNMSTRIEMTVNPHGGPVAITDFDVLASYKDICSLVILRPLTGHKHQLRIHMSKIGFPILGDNRYGHRQRDRKGKIKNLCLHAYSIKIPGYNEIKAAAPEHMRNILDSAELIDVLDGYFG